MGRGTSGVSMGMVGESQVGGTHTSMSTGLKTGGLDTAEQSTNRGAGRSEAGSDGRGSTSLKRKQILRTLHRSLKMYPLNSLKPDQDQYNGFQYLQHKTQFQLL